MGWNPMALLGLEGALSIIELMLAESLRSVMCSAVGGVKGNTA